MRVLLVEPPKIPWEMMGDVVAPPLGLAQLGGCLEAANVPVEILDANALGIGWKGLEAAISRAEPDLIGMTVFTPFVPEIGRAAQVARKAAPEATIVLGGPHVTFTAEETLKSMPDVDLVARGEGDEIIIDLVRALDNGTTLADVPGITYRSNGGFEETPAAPPLDLADTPMPAFHLMPMDRYRFPSVGGPFATVVTSRGCPFKCTFCSEWPFWRGGWRPHEPEWVIEQVDALVNRYARNNIWFGDDCFNVDGDHVAAICEGILQRGIEVNWYYQGRADLLVKNKEILALTREAGCRMVQLGIEASNEEQRAELNKHLRAETVEEAVQLLHEHDIVCQGMFITGLPSDNPRTFEQKVQLVDKLKIDFPVFVIYTLFPGAPDYEEAMAQGQIELPADYAHHDMAHVLLPPREMTVQQVYAYTRWAWVTVYLNPGRLVRNMLSRNDWRRQNWGGMLAYIAKQTARNLVPRFR